MDIFEWVTTIYWNPNLMANGFKLNMTKPSFQLDLQCLTAKQICFSIILWSIDSHGRRNLKRKSPRNVHGHLWPNWMPPG